MKLGQLWKLLVLLLLPAFQPGHAQDGPQPSVASCVASSVQQLAQSSCAAFAWGGSMMPVNGTQIATRDRLVNLLSSCVLNGNSQATPQPMRVLLPGGFIAQNIVNLTRTYAEITKVPIFLDLRTTPQSFTQGRAQSINFPRNQTTTHEAWLVSPSAVGDGLFSGAFKDVSTLVLNDKRMDWSGLLLQLREGLVFGSKVIALPLQSYSFMLFYRTDIYQQQQLDVPRTWDQLVATVQSLHAKRLAAQSALDAALAARLAAANSSSTASNGSSTLDGVGSGAAGNGTVGPLLSDSEIAALNATASTSVFCGAWGPCGSLALNLFKYILASYTQTHGQQQGWFIDPDTMNLLMDSPAFDKVVWVIKELFAVSPPDAGLASGCALPVVAFAQGTCAMTISWGTTFKYSSHIGRGSPLRGKIGVAPMPGTPEVLDRQSNTLRRCSGMAQCPSSTRLDTINGTLWVNRSPGFEATMVPINEQRPAELIFYAYSVMSYLSSPGPSDVMVFDKDAEVFPSRTTQLDPKLWEAAGFDYGDSSRYVQVHNDAFTHLNMHIQVRIPGASRLVTLFGEIGVNASQGMRADVIRPVAVAKVKAILADVYRGSDGAMNMTMLQEWYWAHLSRTAAPPPPAPSTPLPVPELSQDDNSKRTVTIVLGVVLPVLVLGLLAGAGIRLLAKYRLSQRTTFRTAPGVGKATTLLVSDIEGSTQLWETFDASVMDAAHRVHNACIRDLVAQFKGYESATEGDSFVCAFKHPSSALACAMTAQKALLLLDWPPELLSSKLAQEVWVAPSTQPDSCQPDKAGAWARDKGLSLGPGLKGAPGARGSPRASLAQTLVSFTHLFVRSSTPQQQSPAHAQQAQGQGAMPGGGGGTSVSFSTRPTARSTGDGALQPSSSLTHQPSTSSHHTSAWGHQPNSKLYSQSTGDAVLSISLNASMDAAETVGLSSTAYSSSRPSPMTVATTGGASSQQGSAAQVAELLPRVVEHPDESGVGPGSATAASAVAVQAAAACEEGAPTLGVDAGGANFAGVVLMSARWRAGWVYAKRGAPGAVLALRGLRVRMGLHCGVASASEFQDNKVMRRRTYTGPVRVLSGAVCSAGHGGQVMITNQVLFELGYDSSGVLQGLPSDCSIYHMGQHKLKDEQEGAGSVLISELYQVLPRSLRCRLALQQAQMRTLECLVPWCLDAPLPSLPLVAGSPRAQPASLPTAKSGKRTLSGRPDGLFSKMSYEHMAIKNPPVLAGPARPVYIVAVQFVGLKVLMGWDSTLVVPAIAIARQEVNAEAHAWRAYASEDGLQPALDRGLAGMQASSSTAAGMVPGRMVLVHSSVQAAVSLALALRRRLAAVRWSELLLEHELCEPMGNWRQLSQPALSHRQIEAAALAAASQGGSSAEWAIAHPVNPATPRGMYTDTFSKLDLSKLDLAAFMDSKSLGEGNSLAGCSMHTSSEPGDAPASTTAQDKTLPPSQDAPAGPQQAYAMLTSGAPGAGPSAWGHTRQALPGVPELHTYQNLSAEHAAGGMLRGSRGSGATRGMSDGDGQRSSSHDSSLDFFSSELAAERLRQRASHPPPPPLSSEPVGDGSVLRAQASLPVMPSAPSSSPARDLAADPAALRGTPMTGSYTPSASSNGAAPPAAPASRITPGATTGAQLPAAGASATRLRSNMPPFTAQRPPISKLMRTTSGPPVMPPIDALRTHSNARARPHGHADTCTSGEGAAACGSCPSSSGAPHRVSAGGEGSEIEEVTGASLPIPVPVPLARSQPSGSNVGSLVGGCPLSSHMSLGGGTGLTLDSSYGTTSHGPAQRAPSITPSMLQDAHSASGASAGTEELLGKLSIRSRESAGQLGLAGGLMSPRVVALHKLNKPEQAGLLGGLMQRMGKGTRDRSVIPSTSAAAADVGTNAGPRRTGSSGGAGALADAPSGRLSPKLSLVEAALSGLRHSSVEGLIKGESGLRTSPHTSAGQTQRPSGTSEGQVGTPRAVVPASAGGAAAKKGQPVVYVFDAAGMCGLRVRVCMVEAAAGDVTAEVHPSTGRVVYSGKHTKLVERLLAAAKPGQLVVSTTAPFMVD